MKMFRNIGALLLIAAIQFGYLAYQDIQQPLPEPVRLGPILPEWFAGRAEFHPAGVVKLAGVRENGEAFWERGRNAQKIIVSAEHRSDVFSRVVVIRFMLADGGAPYWTSQRFQITEWPNNFWIEKVERNGEYLLVFPKWRTGYSDWLPMSIIAFIISALLLTIYITYFSLGVRARAA